MSTLLLPRRIYTPSALWLPRVIAIGVVVATIGVVVAFGHRPGIVSVADLVAITLFTGGLSFAALGIRADEGTAAGSSPAQESRVLPLPVARRVDDSNVYYLDDLLG